MKYLLYLIVAVLIVACTTSKKSTDNNKHITSVKDTIDPETADHFVVSFISIGQGTDHFARQQFTDFITMYEQKNKIKLIYKSTYWGKEGEMDYCFALSKLEKKQQEAFITETKEILKNSSLVRFIENTTCQ